MPYYGHIPYDPYEEDEGGDDGIRTREIDYTTSRIKPAEPAKQLALPPAGKTTYNKTTDLGAGWFNPPFTSKPDRYYYFNETIELDEDHRLVPMAHKCDPDAPEDISTLGFMYEHLDDDGEQCGGFIQICSHNKHAKDVNWRRWKVEREQPLKLSPSVVCTSCGDHGWVEGGLWKESMLTTTLYGTVEDVIDYGPVVLILFLTTNGRLHQVGAQSKLFWRRAEAIGLISGMKVKLSRSGLGGLTDLDVDDFKPSTTLWSSWNNTWDKSQKSEKKRKKAKTRERLVSEQPSRKRTPF